MRIRSKSHLRKVASNPCMICESPEVQAHHLLKADGLKGMGLKTGDNFTVPLCYICHSALHRNGNEPAFFEIYGWDYEDVKDLARRLWERYNSSAK